MADAMDDEQLFGGARNDEDGLGKKRKAADGKPAVSVEGGGKGQASSSSRREVLDELVVATAQVESMSAAAIRQIKSETEWTIAIPAADPIAVAVARATKAYSEKVAGNKGHEFGLSDYWAFSALIRGVLKFMDEGGDKEKLAAIVAGLGSWKDYKKRVSTCRLKKCHNDAMKKLEICLCPKWQDVLEVIAQFLDGREGVIIYEGKSAPGALNNKLNKLLDKLGAWKTK